MPLVLQLAVAAILIAAGGGMAFFELARERAGTPLLRGEYAQVGYWMTYLSLIVLGATAAIAAVLR